MLFIDPIFKIAYEVSISKVTFTFFKNLLLIIHNKRSEYTYFYQREAT